VFSESGLVPLADSYTLTREMSNVVQTGPATVKVGTAVATQPWGRAATPTDPFRMQTLVSADTGGGVVDAPLVFAGRGIVPSDYPSLPACPSVLCGRPDIGRFLQTYGNDYATVDVRGKVVLLVRFLGVATKGINPMQNDYAFGPSVDESIAGAIQRGAAAVIFVDPALTYYTDTVESYTIALGGIVGGVNPYLRLQHDSPATKTGGVPVVVIDGPTAQGLVAPLGLNILQYLNYDEVRTDKYNVSPARALGITARVEVPLQQQRASVASLAAEVRDVPPGAGRIVVWAVRASASGNAAADVVAAVARALGARPVPFVFVDFDPSIDPRLNAQAVGEALKDRRIALVIVLDKLDGKALRFTTPYGDLIPTLDLYAESAGARHELTRTTPTIGSFAGVAPFIKVKTVLVSGDGGDGDLRPDAAALIGYLAGRLALGAEELPR
jgi:hypothetical protein